ncbi:NnrU family protein [Teredinibacter sp. KSP-S5-2]|uniref:NnrU family protein n=1 Tax=Teredinibacter sp. KSP-S5-2 TaxID=3034506 RepID=UPI0029347D76|nr:NnrU family protein [Teredinibacter sp. KSP-S5-2]WNO10972.1 NnrU family protein [Teredinibacter sp. KSP-S5-2]
MVYFIVGMVLFFGVHLVPNMGNVRNNLISKYGENGYAGAYALIALIGLVLYSIGYAKAEFVFIYEPSALIKQFTMVLMFFSIFFLVAMFAPNNIGQKVRHPMLIAVIIWGIAHCVANGDLWSLVFFFGFVVFSIFKIVSLNKRNKPPVKKSIPWRNDFIVFVIACVAYGVEAYFHQYISGMPVWYLFGA